jgi:hypothetical protein
VSRGGCQARMGLVAVLCAAAGSRTFALDSRAVVPHLHHDAPGDLVGQYSGEGGVLPRSPSSLGGRSGRSAMSTRRPEGRKALSVPATVRPVGSPITVRGGHAPPYAALPPETSPHARRHRRPGSLAGGSKSERSATAARWRRGMPLRGRDAAVVPRDLRWGPPQRSGAGRIKAGRFVPAVRPGSSPG